MGECNSAFGLAALLATVNQCKLTSIDKTTKITEKPTIMPDIFAVSLRSVCKYFGEMMAKASFFN